MTICPNCRAENADGAHFCAACGTSLVPACTRCGTELSEGARFCASCGTPVESLPEPGRERKIVTILFADITGSTALGERLDPEKLQGVMNAFFTAMREEIEAEGGTVEKYIGDAVMAAFGVPAAHEDDPARAVRAAARMLDRLRGLNRELEQAQGVELEIRVGINTGEVIATTDPRPGEAMVAGDTVNVAARLEQAAEPGTVLVSERTARAARGFRFEELPEGLDLRGREAPVGAVRLVTDLPEPELPERGIPGLRAPLVGRDEELGVLQSVYRRAVAEARPNLVTIYGDPGVGKSRLTQEFVAWAEKQEPGPLVVRGRCLPYGDGITYWPLAEILKSQAGVLDSDTADEALEKIRAFASHVLAEGLSPDPARAAAALAFTMGLEDPQHDFGALPPRQVRVELHAAWRSLFSGLARERPVLVLIEDIHWGDEALLDLLDELADRVVGSAMLLCPARPELTQRHPGWGGGRRNSSGVFLEPLSTEDARTLIGHLLSVEELPESVRRRILERAEGNPFFVEEIIRQLIDEQRIVRNGRRWRAAEAIEEVVIPDTVQGVLAARIDLLAPAEKRTLQSAAVVGRVFWTGPVGKLLNGEAAELEDLLARLEERELVSARVGSTIGGEREYIFKHVLTRDVAYGSLPKTDRARAHGNVARWIESTTGERKGEFAELLAYHYLEAFRGARDDSARTPDEIETLRAAAFQSAVTASREAAGRFAVDRARHLAESATDVASNDRERALALEAAGDATILKYDGDAAYAHFAEAIRVMPEQTDEDRAVIALLCAKHAEIPARWPGSMRRIPDPAEVRASLDRGLALAPPGDSVTRARMLTVAAFWPFAFPETVDEAGDREATAAGEEATAMALRLDLPQLASAALDGVCSVYFNRNDYRRWLPAFDRRLALAPKLHDPLELGDLFAVGAWGTFHIGRYRQSLEYADRGLEAAGEVAGASLHCLAWRAVSLVRMGRWDEVIATMARFNDVIGERWETPPGFAFRAYGAAAYVLECMGNRGAAERYLSVVTGIVQTDQGGGLYGASSFVGELYGRRGEFDRAREALAPVVVSTAHVNKGLLLEARCELVAEEGTWDSADELVREARAVASESGLEALPAFADRLEGRAAQAAGRPDDAARSLRRALDRFETLESVWEAARTRLDLATALVPSSPMRAKAEAAAALEDLERVGAIREIQHARDLIGSLE